MTLRQQLTDSIELENKILFHFDQFMHTQKNAEMIALHHNAWAALRLMRGHHTEADMRFRAAERDTFGMGQEYKTQMQEIGADHAQKAREAKELYEKIVAEIETLTQSK